MVSVAVVADPDRTLQVREIVSKLGRDVAVIFTQDSLTLWENVRRAWLAGGHRPYHLVLFDDVQLCGGFWERAVDFRLAHPDGIVSYFYGSLIRHVGSLEEADLEAGYKTMPASAAWPFSPAICLPSYLIRDMVTYADRLTRVYGDIADDVRIFRYFAKINGRAHYSLPSLVEYAPPPDLPGRLSRPGRRGRAAWFAGIEDPSLDQGGDPRDSIKPRPAVSPAGGYQSLRECPK